MANENVQVRVGATGLAESIRKQARMGEAAIARNPVKLRLDTKGFKQPLGRITHDVGEFNKSMDASVARVLAFGAAMGVMSAATKSLKAMVDGAIKVEKSLKDVNVILNLTNSQLSKFGDQLFDVARNTAQTFDTVAEAAKELARQGLSAEETLKRINDAMILSRLSGLGAVESVSALTAAVNSFAKAGVTTTQVINRLAMVDAAFAVSSADLANALQRAGAAAQSAKVEFNELLAVTASVQQQTARGGAIIGNAFKSIFTRLQRARVRETLEELGVATETTNGQLRSAMDVLKDYAKVYKDLSDQQRAYTDQQIAGLFQINNLKALLSDLTSEYSLYDKALRTADGATNQATARNKELNKTLSALLTQTGASVDELAAKMGELGATEGLERFINMVKTVTDFLNNILGSGEGDGNTFAKNLVRGIGGFLTGPGLIVVGAALAKIFAMVSKFGFNAMKEILGLNVETKRQESLQKGITAVLMKNEDLMQQIMAASGNTAKQEQILLSHIKAETVERQKQEMIIKRISASPAFMGVGAGPTGFAPAGRRASKRIGKATLGMAGGFVPSFGIEARNIQKRVGGAKPGRDKPVLLKKHKMGGGKSRDVVAHTGEWIVRNFKGTGGDAIYTRNMARSFGLPKGAKKITAASGLLPTFSKGGMPKGFLTPSSRQLTSSGQKAKASTKVIDATKLVSMLVPAPAGNLPAVGRVTMPEGHIQTVRFNQIGPRKSVTGKMDKKLDKIAHDRIVSGSRTFSRILDPQMPKGHIEPPKRAEWASTAGRIFEAGARSVLRSPSFGSETATFDFMGGDKSKGGIFDWKTPLADAKTSSTPKNRKSMAEKTIKFMAAGRKGFRKEYLGDFRKDPKTMRGIEAEVRKGLRSTGVQTLTGEEQKLLMQHQAHPTRATNRAIEAMRKTRMGGFRWRGKAFSSGYVPNFMDVDGGMSNMGISHLGASAQSQTLSAPIGTLLSSGMTKSADGRNLFKALKALGVTTLSKGFDFTGFQTRGKTRMAGLGWNKFGPDESFENFVKTNSTAKTMQKNLGIKPADAMSNKWKGDFFELYSANRRTGNLVDRGAAMKGSLSYQNAPFDFHHEGRVGEAKSFNALDTSNTKVKADLVKKTLFSDSDRGLFNAVNSKLSKGVGGDVKINSDLASEMSKQGYPVRSGAGGQIANKNDIKHFARGSLLRWRKTFNAQKVQHALSTSSMFKKKMELSPLAGKDWHKAGVDKRPRRGSPQGLFRGNLRTRRFLRGIGAAEGLIPNFSRWRGFSGGKAKPSKRRGPKGESSGKEGWAHDAYEGAYVKGTHLSNKYGPKLLKDDPSVPGLSDFFFAGGHTPNFARPYGATRAHPGGSPTGRRMPGPFGHQSRQRQADQSRGGLLSHPLYKHGSVADRELIEKYIRTNGFTRKGIPESTRELRLQQMKNMGLDPERLKHFVGAARGYIPNFARLMNWGKAGPGFGNESQLTMRDTGSYVRYERGRKGLSDIAFMQSNQKGDASLMFANLLKREGKIASGLINRQNVWKAHSQTNFEDLVHAYPQLKYRLKKGMVTSGKMVLPDGGSFNFKSLKELKSRVNADFDREQFRRMIEGEGPIGGGKMGVFDLNTNFKSGVPGDNIYNKYAGGYIPKGLRQAIKREKAQLPPGEKVLIERSKKYLNNDIGVYSEGQRQQYGGLDQTIKKAHLDVGQTRSSLHKTGSGREFYKAFGFIPNFKTDHRKKWRRLVAQEKEARRVYAEEGQNVKNLTKVNEARAELRHMASDPEASKALRGGDDAPKRFRGKGKIKGYRATAAGRAFGGVTTQGLIDLEKKQPGVAPASKHIRAADTKLLPMREASALSLGQREYSPPDRRTAGKGGFLPGAKIIDPDQHAKTVVEQTAARVEREKDPARGPKGRQDYNESAVRKETDGTGRKQSLWSRIKARLGIGEKPEASQRKIPDKDKEKRPTDSEKKKQTDKLTKPSRRALRLAPKKPRDERRKKVVNIKAAKGVHEQRALDAKIAKAQDDYRKNQAAADLHDEEQRQKAAKDAEAKAARDEDSRRKAAIAKAQGESAATNQEAEKSARAKHEQNERERIKRLSDSEAEGKKDRDAKRGKKILPLPPPKPPPDTDDIKTKPVAPHAPKADPDSKSGKGSPTGAGDEVGKKLDELKKPKRDIWGNVKKIGAAVLKAPLALAAAPFVAAGEGLKAANEKLKGDGDKGDKNKSDKADKDSTKSTNKLTKSNERIVKSNKTLEQKIAKYAAELEAGETRKAAAKTAGFDRKQLATQDYKVRELVKGGMSRADAIKSINAEALVTAEKVAKAGGIPGKAAAMHLTPGSVPGISKEKHLRMVQSIRDRQRHPKDPRRRKGGGKERYGSGRVKPDPKEAKPTKTAAAVEKGARGMQMGMLGMGVQMAASMALPYLEDRVSKTKDGEGTGQALNKAGAGAAQAAQFSMFLAMIPGIGLWGVALAAVIPLIFGVVGALDGMSESSEEAAKRIGEEDDKKSKRLQRESEGRTSAIQEVAKLRQSESGTDIKEIRNSRARVRKALSQIQDKEEREEIRAMIARGDSTKKISQLMEERELGTAREQSKIAAREILGDEESFKGGYDLDDQEEVSRVYDQGANAFASVLEDLNTGELKDFKSGLANSSNANQSLYESFVRMKHAQDEGNTKDADFWKENFEQVKMTKADIDAAEGNLKRAGMGESEGVKNALKAARDQSGDGSQEALKKLVVIMREGSDRAVPIEKAEDAEVVAGLNKAWDEFQDDMKFSSNMWKKYNSILKKSADHQVSMVDKIGAATIDLISNYAKSTSDLTKNVNLFNIDVNQRLGSIGGFEAIRQKFSEERGALDRDNLIDVGTTHARRELSLRTESGVTQNKVDDLVRGYNQDSKQMAFDVISAVKPEKAGEFDKDRLKDMKTAAKEGRLTPSNIADEFGKNLKSSVKELTFEGTKSAKPADVAARLKSKDNEITAQNREVASAQSRVAAAEAEYDRLAREGKLTEGYASPIGVPVGGRGHPVRQVPTQAAKNIDAQQATAKAALNAEKTKKANLEREREGIKKQLDIFGDQGAAEVEHEKRRGETKAAKQEMEALVKSGKHQQAVFVPQAYGGTAAPMEKTDAAKNLDLKIAAAEKLEGEARDKLATINRRINKDSTGIQSAREQGAEETKKMLKDREAEIKALSSSDVPRKMATALERGQENVAASFRGLDQSFIQQQQKINFQAGKELAQLELQSKIAEETLRVEEDQARKMEALKNLDKLSAKMVSTSEIKQLRANADVLWETKGRDTSRDKVLAANAKRLISEQTGVSNIFGKQDRIDLAGWNVKQQVDALRDKGAWAEADKVQQSWDETKKEIEAGNVAGPFASDADKIESAIKKLTEVINKKLIKSLDAPMRIEMDGSMTASLIKVDENLTRIAEEGFRFADDDQTMKDMNEGLAANAKELKELNEVLKAIDSFEKSPGSEHSWLDFIGKARDFFDRDGNLPAQMYGQSQVFNPTTNPLDPRSQRMAGHGLETTGDGEKSVLFARGGKRVASAVDPPKWAEAYDKDGDGNISGAERDAMSPDEVAKFTKYQSVEEVDKRIGPKRYAGSMAPLVRVELPGNTIRGGKDAQYVEDRFKEQRELDEWKKLNPNYQETVLPGGDRKRGIGSDTAFTAWQRIRSEQRTNGKGWSGTSIYGGQDHRVRTDNVKNLLSSYLRTQGKDTSGLVGEKLSQIAGELFLSDKSSRDDGLFGFKDFGDEDELGWIPDMKGAIDRFSAAVQVHGGLPTKADFRSLLANQGAEVWKKTEGFRRGDASRGELPLGELEEGFGQAEETFIRLSHNNLGRRGGLKHNATTAEKEQWDRAAELSSAERKRDFKARSDKVKVGEREQANINRLGKNLDEFYEAIDQTLYNAAQIPWPKGPQGDSGPTGIEGEGGRQAKLGEKLDENAEAVRQLASTMKDGLKVVRTEEGSVQLEISVPELLEGNQVISEQLAALVQTMQEELSKIRAEGDADDGVPT